MKPYIKANKNAYNALADEYKVRLASKSAYEEPLDSLVGKSVSYVKERFGKVLALDIGPESCCELTHFTPHLSF